jgi:hypothetical protein
VPDQSGGAAGDCSEQSPSRTRGRWTLADLVSENRKWRTDASALVGGPTVKRIDDALKEQRYP